MSLAGSSLYLPKSSSDGDCGVSLNRTVFDLRNSAGDVEDACAKSAASESELASVRVASVDGEENPWNCAVKSSNCF